MKCSYTTDNLISFLFNELKEKEMLNMGKHLEACSSCQRQLTELQDLKVAWDYPHQGTLSENFTNLIMKELEIETMGKRKLLAHYNLNTLTHFSMASAATFALLYFGGLGKYFNLLDDFALSFIKASNNLNLAVIKGTIWLDGLAFQLTNLTNIF